MSQSTAPMAEIYCEPLDAVVPLPLGWAFAFNDDSEVLSAWPDPAELGTESTGSLTLKRSAWIGEWPELRALAEESKAALAEKRAGYTLLDEVADPEDRRVHYSYRYDDGPAGPKAQLQLLAVDGQLLILTCTASEEEFPALAATFASIANAVHSEAD